MKNQSKSLNRIKLSPRVITIGVVCFWVLSLALTWYLTSGAFNKPFPMLNPRLDNLKTNTPEERNSKLFTTLFPLKEQLMAYLGNNKNNVALYVEDLNSGSWIGWQERQSFIPASLLKVPVAVGVMKKIDDGDWNLDTTTFQMDEKYKDKNYGDLWKVANGDSLTVRRLLQDMLDNSDNTAARIFLDKLTIAEKENVYYHIGLADPEKPSASDPTQPENATFSAKDLATVFRSLYNATYLTTKSSNYILDLLTKTKFDAVIPSAVPSNVRVAHKIGNYFNSDTTRPKNYHDCGITYYPGHPYLYCIMTQTYEPETAEKIISDLGNKIYLYFDKDGGQK